MQPTKMVIPPRQHKLAFAQVVVIDRDLGRSGSGSQERPGFAQLLSAVCQGVAGAVLALGASRLARSSPLSIVSQVGLTVLSANLLDGGTQMSFDHSGLDVGETLVSSKYSGDRRCDSFAQAAANAGTTRDD